MDDLKLTADKFCLIPRSRKNVSREELYKSVMCFMSGEDKLLEDVLVIGHGRSHQKILNVDYESATFVDIDPKCNPDIVCDVKYVNSITSDKFSYVLFANSSYILSKLSFVGNIYIDSLDLLLLGNVHKCLVLGGKMITQNVLGSSGVSDEKFISEVENTKKFRWCDYTYVLYQCANGRPQRNFTFMSI